MNDVKDLVVFRAVSLNRATELSVQELTDLLLNTMLIFQFDACRFLMNV